MPDNPLVSVIVLAYKQERFVRDAIRSVFAQDYAPLEIVLSDDCSPDKTFEIIKEEAAAYTGSNTIIVNHNKKNLGLASHTNRAWELTSGQLVVGQAGDDISVPHRISRLVARWRDHTAPVDLVCSYFAEMDVGGQLTGVVEKNVAFVPDTTKDVLSWACGATGACAAYSRKLYEKYGPLDPGVLAEDWVFSFRAWLESGIGVVEEPLLLHRTHDDSISVSHGRNIRTERNVALRRSRRRRNAENRSAIAREWARAWEISNRHDENGRIARNLRRLVRVRELQHLAFDRPGLQSFGIAFRVCKEKGGLLNALKVLARHGVGRY